MPQYHFITGHHRAGTHEFAEKLAKETGLLVVEEGLYMFDSMAITGHPVLDELLRGQVTVWGGNGKQTVNVPAFVEDGFILQCPGLACWLPELAKIGKVYWCTRKAENVAASQSYGNFGSMLWDVMKSFKKQFPDDEIWGKLKYKDREDPHSGFIGYAFLLYKVKEYFFDKYFKKLVESVVELEKQAYYDYSKTSVAKRPLNQTRLDRIQKVKVVNETFSIS